MTFIEGLAIVFWPMTSVVAIFLVWLWRRMWRVRPNLFVFIAVFTSIFLTVLLFKVIGHESAAGVLDLGVFDVLLGAFFLVPLFFARRRLRGAKGIAAGSIALVFGLLFFGNGSRNLIGDFVLSRQYVVGTVEKIYENSGRSGRYYHVYINGQHHPTTANVFAQLRRGDRIRAEIGAGSGTIYSAKPL